MVIISLKITKGYRKVTVVVSRFNLSVYLEISTTIIYIFCLSYVLYYYNYDLL
jgi:hypothetical protein